MNELADTVTSCSILSLAFIKNCSAEIDNIKNIIIIFGVIFTSYYGYRKFVHGRIYHERITPNLKLRTVSQGTDHWLIATASIKNTGIRRVRLKHRECHMIFYAVFPDQNAPQSTDPYLFSHYETEIRVVKIFRDERYLEPSDEVEDTRAILVRNLRVVGYKADFRISEDPINSSIFLPRNNSWKVNDYFFLNEEKDDGE